MLPKIEWKKYCDRIFCIHCGDYKDRIAGMQEELRRVDLLDSGVLEIRENFKNPVDNFLKSKMGVDPRSLIMPLFIETYRILAESRFKGYQRIAIMEDDARFLKDKNLIAELMESVPTEANCIQMNRMTSCSRQIAANWNRCKGSAINRYFVKGDGCEIWGGAFYLLTGNGMGQLLDIMAQTARNPDGLFHRIHGLSICTKDIAIQKPMAQSVRGESRRLAEMDFDRGVFGTQCEEYAV